MGFQAQAATAYRLWLRGKAQNDNWANDSVFVQFSDSLGSSGGAPVFRIGTTSGSAINLEDCSGCGLQGWGWQDNGWGVGVLGPLIYFANTGTHTIRIQVREDGLSIDQIVLSPATYLNTAPGALNNDSTILPESGGGGSGAPTVTSISPNTGSTAGGTSVTITGTNFVVGATVSIGGAPATNVTVSNSTSITAVTPAHSAGTVVVVVSNPDGQSGTLPGGFTYSAPPAPAPTVAAVSPNSGPAAGGTAVTINGTNFVSGATVTFGGAIASNVNVTSSTSLTAVTPAHSAGAVNVVVVNPDGQSGTLTGGFTYTGSSGSPPTVTGVSPNAGPTGGGTAVMISGTNFASGATLNFGGVAASNVNVVNSTTISAVTPAHAAGAVDVTVTNMDGLSGTLASGYSYTTGETVLLADDFNDNSLNTTKWNASNMFSGYTDTSLPNAEINQRFEIGPLLQGTADSHYAGIRSASAYDFTNAYCYVQVVQPASSTTSADTMFTLGRDVNDYYRIYV
jgi:hypothetical protein